MVSNSSYSVYGGLEWSTTAVTVCTVVQTGQQQQLQCVRWFRVVNNTYSVYGGLEWSTTAVTVCTVV